MTLFECLRCERERKIKARGLCAVCYNFYLRHPELDPPEKIRYGMQGWYERLDRPDEGCWIWPGARHTHGYGVGATESEHHALAHRWVYEREVGPIPLDMTIDHVCKEKSCVRPDHLEVVTRGENLRRASGDRSAQKRRLGPCTHGDADLYVDPQGKRVCRICRRERTRLWRGDRKTQLGHY